VFISHRPVLSGDQREYESLQSSRHGRLIGRSVDRGVENTSTLVPCNVELLAGDVGLGTGSGGVTKLSLAGSFVVAEIDLEAGEGVGETWDVAHVFRAGVDEFGSDGPDLTEAEGCLEDLMLG
jgi:hypothetical protein